MVFTRSAGDSVALAPEMVTNRRSTIGDCAIGAPAGGAADFAAASGGSSKGHRKTRSTRSCAPGWRCTALRMAAGGTLNATPAIVMGMVGALGETGVPGQRGQSTYP